jgi:hypothetical protein
MSSPVKLYQQEMHKNVGYFANWLPGNALSLGDVGVWEAGRFQKLTTLKDLGVPYAAGVAGSPQTLDYSSTSDTNVSTNAGATAGGVAKAEITVKFSREGAFLFQAIGVQGVDLASRNDTAMGILQALEQSAWKKEWMVIDSLYEATSATIIVSEDTSSELVLSANSALPVASLALADPKLDLTVSSKRGRIVHLVAGSGLHPLYMCMKIKSSLFGGPSVSPVRGLGGGTAAAQSLARPGLNDLLDS